ncbi:hypothetical protein JTE90_007890 [Oedothorax gibbosus]|uniref:Uncharacterized protein n=1 Tax=Oedothorax gibbosus TaxID=931172 RepID=A0AAV6VJE0_9ARAC|nr:hypothetical protein JTE90_007890 [Oedothorax gibbosus]
MEWNSKKTSEHIPCPEPIFRNTKKHGNSAIKCQKTCSKKECPPDRRFSPEICPVVRCRTWYGPCQWEGRTIHPTLPTLSTFRRFHAGIRSITLECFRHFSWFSEGDCFFSRNFWQKLGFVLWEN